jgi:hypothetical protein
MLRKSLGAGKHHNPSTSHLNYVPHNSVQHRREGGGRQDMAATINKWRDSRPATVFLDELVTSRYVHRWKKKRKSS